MKAPKEANEEKAREALKISVETLRGGDVILSPTDTIWGLSCDARNEKAVEKIVAIKERPAEKSFIVLLHADYQLEQYLREVPEVAYDLIEYAEKPLTIIFSGARGLAPNVIHSDGSIGIRIVRPPVFVKRLLEAFRGPLVSTSANLSGQPSPQGFADIDEKIKQGVDYIVPPELALESPSKPSTIISLGPGGEYKLIRK